MFRAAALTLTAGLSLAACAETPPRTDAAANGIAAETSAASPMTVNPAPVTPEGRAIPETPPTLPRDPARQDHDAMPPGPVNPG